MAKSPRTPTPEASRSTQAPLHAHSEDTERQDTDDHAATSTKESVNHGSNESTQSIWQVGMGVLSKAQSEGTKALETLAKDSAIIRQKTKAAAEEKLSEASHLVSSMANEQWSKLESIFEQRVAKALGKLRAPSAHDIQALNQRLDALADSLAQLRADTVLHATELKSATGRPVSRRLKASAASLPVGTGDAKTTKATAPKTTRPRRPKVST